jgi:DNA replication protein DnaC
MKNIKQSPSEHLCQRCQQPLNADEKYRCAACEKKVEEEIRQYQEQERQQKIVRRHQEISRRLGAVIPRLFVSAEIENLSAGLQGKINSLSADKGLFLFGPVGCGKSYTLAAIAKQHIQQGLWPVGLLNWERFLMQLRASYDGEPGEADRILFRTMKSDALFLDDICIAGTESEFSLKTLLSVFDYRVENCLPTFFSSNRSPDEISKAFDERTYSRIIGHCEVIYLDGKDKRKGKTI